MSCSLTWLSRDSVQAPCMKSTQIYTVLLDLLEMNIKRRYKICICCSVILEGLESFESELQGLHFYFHDLNFGWI